MMRVVFFSLFVILFSCDQKRIIEEYKDISTHSWAIRDTLYFSLSISKADTVNLYCNVRNNLEYPFSRIFIHYTLCDSVGHELAKDMMKEHYLFDSKTGEPLGQSGIGDIFDHQLLLQKMKVTKGQYQLKIAHKMRTDVLPGILAVGVRVEKER